MPSPRFSHGEGTSSGRAYRCAECGWETASGSAAAASARRGARWPRSACVTSVRAQAGPVTTAGRPDRPGVGQGVDVPRSSGVPELDRVLGGGLVPGAAILLAGEPGVGKSTLLLEVAAQTARTSRRTLYITGEESASQVRLRADRTGGVHDELYLAAETDLGAVLSHIEQVRPELIVVDSVQTIGAAETDGAPGGARLAAQRPLIAEFRPSPYREQFIWDTTQSPFGIPLFVTRWRLSVHAANGS